MTTIEDFENAPVGATATHDNGGRAVKMDDSERGWIIRTGDYWSDELIERWGYTLEPPAPTTAREALDLAWELAHPVKEGQVIPEGSRYLEGYSYGLKECTASRDIKTSLGGVPVRTLDPLPEPEPDWLDAPAVLARVDEWASDELEVFIPAHEGEGRWVAMFSALTYHWSDLRDVTPLYPKEGQDA